MITKSIYKKQQETAKNILKIGFIFLLFCLPNKALAVCTVSGGGTICAGSSINLTYTTSGSAAAGINWQYSANGVTGWINVVNGTPSGVSYSGNTTLTLAITTTGAATAGTYYFRATHVSGTNCGGPYSSAAVSVTIVAPPTTANAGTDIVNICTTTATLAGNTPVAGSGTWTVVSGTATITSPILPNSGVTGLVVGASATLRWTVTNAPCADSFDDVIITVNTGPGCSTYCTSNATSTADEEILNVTFGTLNNSSTCATTGGAGSILNEYSNYTGIAAPTVTQGVAVAFSVQIGTCGGNYTNAMKIFIDYNQDGDFADLGEEVYVSPSAISGPHTESGNIIIPVTASLGNTRMRVVNVETGTPSSITACGTYAWGETEDYTINIASSGPMIFTSSTTTQTNTSSVPKCGTDQQIIGVEVVTTGSSSPLTLTQFQINMNGSTIPGTNTNDVTKIHIYYTGTSSTFSAVGAYDGVGTNVAAGTISIGGSQILATGTNYFWIAYDINSISSTLGNVLDAQCTRITVAAVNYIPTTTSPAGSRTIAVCDPSPGGVATGLETWVRADMGVTGTTPVTAWANQKVTGTAVLVNGSPNLNNTATTYNYNPYVDFTAPVGTLSNGLAANRQFLKLSGYTDVAGLNYTSLFFAFQLTDLTRANTHIATVENVTNFPPANGCLHGEVTGGLASIFQEVYDATDFGSGTVAGTWRRNGINITNTTVHSTQKHVLSANCFTGGSTTLNTFLGGQRDQFDPNAFAGHVRDWRGPCAEIIGYTSALTATQKQKIDSYLALKYGLTLTFNYLSTSGGTIFTVAAPYNNNIIGIGRDDAEALTQKQSHNDDDTVRIYKNTLMGTNAANAGVFGTDISYVVAGANTGKMCATTASAAEMPAACTLYSRLEREWKVVRTNNAETFNMDFKLAPCGAPTSVTVAHLRLLVDDDGNFSNGGTSCYYNGDGTGIVFTYSNPVITVTGISTTHIANNVTKYITIGSSNSLTPLPVELVEFNAKLNDMKDVDLTWTTATEINNDYFQVEKSQDANHWQNLIQVNGAGNSSTTIDYNTVDFSPFSGWNYYRLKQVDFNGQFDYSEIRMVFLTEEGEINIYPNPTNSDFQIETKDIRDYQIRIHDALGKEVFPMMENISNNIIRYNTSDLSRGIYFIEISSNSERKNFKLIIQ